jgi:hypothetical protein
LSGDEIKSGGERRIKSNEGEIGKSKIKQTNKKYKKLNG